MKNTPKLELKTLQAKRSIGKFAHRLTELDHDANYVLMLKDRFTGVFIQKSSSSDFLPIH